MKYMECSKCGEWQTVHKEPCAHCKAPNSALIIKDDMEDGK